MSNRNISDILVVGGGVAGMSFSIWAAQKYPSKSITVLTKSNTLESNTKYAQGGVAAVWDEGIDDFTKHINDTIDAGDGLCDEEVVQFVIKEGPERIKEIIDWGVRFDKTQKGTYDLGKEGGHSENRILHYKDITGWEIQRSLIEKAKEYNNITILEHFFAIDLITQHHLGRVVTRLSPTINCYGAYALNKKTNKIDTFLANATVLATGGAGQVYKSTTNPVIATGDGIAMVYRAKGRLANMEFVQFHPTSLFNTKGENPSFLISEAVRGFGAILKARDGSTFMENYDERKSLAPRDIVARAIDNEMKVRGDDHVYLDCTHLDKKSFVNHFPNIYDKCLNDGIDAMKDMIPVVPACHYICGGVHIDHYGRTSIKNLYSAGECTNSGLHGANRLASNSLLEGMVYGKRIANIIDESFYISIEHNIPKWDVEGTSHPKEMVLLTQSLKELKEIMSNYVGIVRSDTRLQRAFTRLKLLYEETETLYATTTISPQLCELRNLITNAYLITKSAIMRKESRGLHYNTDFPDEFNYKSNTWL